MLYTLSQNDNTKRSPGQQKDTECDRDKPVQGRCVDGATKDDMERRRVGDEDRKTSTKKDPDKVPLVVDNMATKRVSKFGLHSKNIEALGYENREVEDGLGLTKCINLITSANGPPTVIEEVRTTFEEIYCKGELAKTQGWRGIAAMKISPPADCACFKSEGENPFFQNTTK